MENIITYIIVFGLGFGFIGLYMFHKDKQKILPLSRQMYSDVILTISVIKQQKAVKELLIQLKFNKKALAISDIYIELINKKRETSALSVFDKVENKTDEHTTPFELKWSLNFQDFKELVEQHDFSFESFKLVTETSEGRKYKSHQLGLHNWWTILKLDSGTYN